MKLHKMENTFFSQALTIGGDIGTPKSTNVPEGVGNATERIAEGLIGSVKGYTMDILKNYGSAIQDVGQSFTGLLSASERGSNSRLKNMGLGLSGAVTHTLRGTANMALGLLGAGDKLYRNGVVDAHSEFSSGTIDRLGKPGLAFGNLRRLAIYIGGIVPRAGNELAKIIDTPFDYFQKNTRPAGRTAYGSELRNNK